MEKPNPKIEPNSKVRRKMKNGVKEWSNPKIRLDGKNDKDYSFKG
jgi:hypothetical protein